MAVFQAMKAFEVAVRDASRLADGMVGVKLMRNAFAADSGILTDFAAEGGERQARADWLRPPSALTRIRSLTET